MKFLTDDNRIRTRKAVEAQPIFLMPHRSCEANAQGDDHINGREGRFVKIL
jgi:hypothetical protein